MDGAANSSFPFAPESQALRLSATVDPNISFAVQQNAVPVIRDFRVHNDGDQTIRDIRIEVTSDPPFCLPCHSFIHSVEARSTCRPEDLTLHLEAAFLRQLDEAMRGQLRFSASTHGQLLAEQIVDVRLLAYDEWAGLQSLPEVLAAFSQPNSPAVDQILSQTAQLLAAASQPASLEGYQSGDPRRIWQITAALYTAISGLNITYANPPASFEQTGQKVRTPDRIVATGLATCLDLALLFASCLEQAGLNPLVVIHKGHAYAGVWLTDQHFSQAVQDDLQTLRKRAQLDELLVFETTVVTGPAPAAFQVALDRGREHLDRDAQFEMALDIRQSRVQRILPLPLRSGDGQMQAQPSGASPVPSPLPTAPDRLTAATGADAAGAETSRDRIERWKRRLLDLSLRNRLLNWKETSATVRPICPEPDRLEATLSAGGKLRFLPLDSVLRRDDPRNQQIFQQRTGDDLLQKTAAGQLDHHELLVDLSAKDLSDRLTKIYRSSITDLEEGGANTLFLAFGFLAWQQKEKTAKPLYAPILLLPVTLERPSIRHGFTLTRHEDEAQVNPTLLQLLDQDFQLKIPGLDPLPADGESIDIARVLRQFREAVRDIDGWEVREDVTLGLFSFAKYLMWKDLQERTEELRQNPVVSRLMDPSGSTPLASGAIPQPRELDDQCPPSQLFCPLIADSSQFAAVAAARSGQSFVLDGPPGTGKSQTIANIIAHSLAEGKRVLFVSEKLAALDVVQRRLEAVGLAPFCLQLHSAKAKRADIVRQLAHTIEFAGQRPVPEWDQSADRLARLRSHLNQYVRELHRQHDNGWTPFRALSRVIAGRDAPVCEFAWPDADGHDNDALEKLRDLVASLATLAGAAGDARQPLLGLSHTEWSPAWEAQLRKALSGLEEAARSLLPSAEKLCLALGLPEASLSAAAGAQLDRLAAALLEFLQHQGPAAASALSPEFRARCVPVCACGRQRNLSWASLNHRYQLQATRLPLQDLRSQWSAAAALWWPRSVFEQRRIRKQLASVSRSGALPAATEVPADLETLAAVARHDQTLAATPPALIQTFSSLWNGADTDWERVSRLADWGARIESLCTALLPDLTARQTLLQRLADRFDQSPQDLLPGGALAQPLAQFRDAWQALQAARDAFENVITCQPGLVWGSPDAPAYVLNILAQCARWSGQLRALRPWCAWQASRQLADTAGLSPLLALLDAQACTPAQLPGVFDFNYARWWLAKILDCSDLLRSFIGAEQGRKISDFRALDEQFTRLTRDFIVARLASRLPQVHADPGSDSEMGTLAREIQKQRGHLPLRRLIARIPNALERLTPCFLMSPLSVAQYLDAAHRPFDLVIFDEASQIPTWDAIGAMARGRQVIVAGDPRQLPPTSFFGRTDDDDDPAEDETLQDLESILDECRATRIPSLSLLWHYRSRNESLITFSNRRYYGNQLLTFPSPVTPDRAVALHPVEGVYDRGGSRTNLLEAQAVVRFVIERLQAHDPIQHHGKTPSLGVVTFNQQQQNLISNLLDRERGENPELDALLSQTNPEPLFVKNLENVQGDERDIMVFSTTFGLDAAGKPSLNFGPLNRDGGERRLNVAVTRARVELHVFSSLPPDQIDLSKTRARGVEDLRVFLEYAQKGPRAIVEAVKAPLEETESPFEEEVLRSLQQRGWSVHAQVGCSGYRIDLAVVDPRAHGRYLLGIECDGAMYHSAATARDRDRLRAMVLEGLGWKLYRIWSTDWWSDSEAQLRQLEAVLNGLLSEAADFTPAVPPEPPTPAPAGPVEGRNEPVLSLFAAAAAPAPALDHALPAEPALPVYQGTAITGLADQNAFYLPAADAMLRAAILEVIEVEGPVAATLLVRRIREAWGFQRSGTRIRSRILDLVPRSIRSTRDGDEIFYWPQTCAPSTWTGFRLPGPHAQQQRPLALICPEELGNLVLHVVGRHAGVSEAQVVRDACRLLGMQQVTNQVEECFQSVVKRLLRSRRIALQAHSLILPE